MTHIAEVNPFREHSCPVNKHFDTLQSLASVYCAVVSHEVEIIKKKKKRFLINDFKSNCHLVFTGRIFILGKNPNFTNYNTNFASQLH